MISSHAGLTKAATSLLPANSLLQNDCTCRNRARINAITGALEGSVALKQRGRERRGTLGDARGQG